LKFFFLLILAILTSGCEPFVKTFPDISQPIMYKAEYLQNSEYSAKPVKVVTWNIRFGSGRLEWFLDSCGERALADYDSAEIIIQNIADTLNSINADIVLLQEVDIQSKRSGYLDQVQFLLDHTYLNYGAYASMSEVDFVPTDGLGRINTGNAILSKYPITDAERIQLRLRTDQDALVKYFYARRNIIKVNIPSLEHNGKKLFAVNIHATAFATDDTKERHIEKYIEVLGEISKGGDLFIAGGDLNSVPPGSNIDFCLQDMCPSDSDSIKNHLKHKEGSYFNNFNGEPTLLMPLYNLYQSAIQSDLFNLPIHFTHAPSTNVDRNGNLTKYDRKLDYLFSNINFKPGSGTTHQRCWKLSDHMPVSASLTFERE